MDELLQAELTKIVTNINNSTESAWSFITEQTPEVIQQLMLWYGVYNVILMLAGIMLIIFILYLNYRQIKFLSTIPDLSDHPEIILNVFQIFWFIPLSLTINFQWLKIWIAPKVWLLEQISSMIK